MKCRETVKTSAILLSLSVYLAIGGLQGFAAVQFNGLIACVAGSSSQAIQPPLRLDQFRELIDLLTDQALAGEIKERGIDFKVDYATLEDLRERAKQSTLDRKRLTITLLESFQDNKAPSVAINFEKKYIVRGESLKLTADAKDVESSKERFYYSWEVSEPGLFEGYGSSIKLITTGIPAITRTLEIQIKVTVQDRQGGSTTKTETVYVVQGFSISLGPSTTTILKGDSVELKATVTGETNGEVTYKWEKSGGQITEYGQKAVLYTGGLDQEKPIEVKVTAVDKRSTSASASKIFYIQTPAMLRLKANVANVDVIIDGEIKATVSQNDFEQINILPREQVIEARKEGYTVWKRTYSLKPQEQKEVLIELKPLDVKARRIALKRLSRAQVLFEEGDYENALIKCKEGIEFDPTSVELIELKQKLEKIKETLISRGEWPPKKKGNVIKRVFVEATVLERVTPIYPPMAKKLNISGKVDVEIDINASGNVVSAKALSGNKNLYSAAEEAAQKWRFNPAQLDGKPAASKKIISFNFQNN